MATIRGIYIGTDATSLAALITQYETARTAILTAHQSYSRPGFSFTRANLAEINNELAELYWARNVTAGTFVTKQVVDLSV